MNRPGRYQPERQFAGWDSHPPGKRAFPRRTEISGPGFVAGFADYPPAHEEIYELTSGHRALPAPLESQSGLFISGVNRSDDLFMFFKGPIDGLTPEASYAVEVSVEIATSTPAGCFGVGGAPGE